MFTTGLLQGHEDRLLVAQFVCDRGEHLRGHRFVEPLAHSVVHGGVGGGSWCSVSDILRLFDHTHGCVDGFVQLAEVRLCQQVHNGANRRYPSG